MTVVQQRGQVEENSKQPRQHTEWVGEADSEDTKVDLKRQQQSPHCWEEGPRYSKSDALAGLGLH